METRAWNFIKVYAEKNMTKASLDAKIRSLMICKSNFCLKDVVIKILSVLREYFHPFVVYLKKDSSKMHTSDICSTDLQKNNFLP